MNDNGSPQAEVEKSLDEEDGESIHVEGQQLCDIFSQEHAPQLVIFMEHIFEEPEHWKAGLSTPLCYTFHLATTNIIGKFESGITQEPSNIFTFQGVPQAPYHVKTADQV